MNKLKYMVLKKFWESVYGNTNSIENTNENDLSNDSLNFIKCRDFILDGKYSYEDVLKLNELTGYSVGFGFSKEVGPVAFIGITDSSLIRKSLYFYGSVPVYGKPVNNELYSFNYYYEEYAKKINDYTVYGCGDPRVLQGQAPIRDVNRFYDYRYISKNEYDNNFNSDVLKMEAKLVGTYSFEGAKKIASGVVGGFNYVGPIQFAIVDGNKPVAIIGLLNQYNDSSFKDVWCKGSDEPLEQSIHFLNLDEAKKIDNFELYYFMPINLINNEKSLVEKVDRTLSDDFDFNIDGIDYRLQSSKEKSFVKNL